MANDLSYKIHISPIDKTIGSFLGPDSIDTRQNIKKRIELFRYSAPTPDNAVNLAFFGSQPVNAVDNMTIANKSFTIRANSPDVIPLDQIITDSGNFLTSYNNFFITDIFTVPSPSKPRRPLFFQHVLDNNVTDAILLDSNFEPVDVKDYVLELNPATTEESFLYNDAESTYDPDTNELEVFYVQEVIASLGVTRTVLLNNVPIFHEATFDDLDAFLNLKPDSQAYLINSVSNQFQITFPKVGTPDDPMGIRLLQNSRIELLKSALNTSEDPWFIRVTNGAFKIIDDTTSYSYSIPEFVNQTFSPISPVKVSARTAVTIINDRILKLNREDIVIDPLTGFTLDLIIKDADDNIIMGLTTDAAKVGDTVLSDEGVPLTSVLWSTQEINSIDSKLGLVRLTVDIQNSWDIDATFRYNENTLQFTDTNYNPIQNPTVLNGYSAYYVIPEASPNENIVGAGRNALMRLDVDNNGIITNTTQGDDTGGNQDKRDAVSTEIDSGPFSNPDTIITVLSTDGFPDSGFLLIADESKDPRILEYISKTPSTFTLAAAIPVSLTLEDGTPIEQYLDEIMPGLHYNMTATSTLTADPMSTNEIDLTDASSFPEKGYIYIDFGTGSQERYRYISKNENKLVGESWALSQLSHAVGAEVRLDNFIDAFAFQSQRPNVFKYLTLGEVFVHDQTTLNDTVLIDARVLGGGIREDALNDIASGNREVNWFWDIGHWDGQAFPGTSVVVIEVPWTVLQEFGGQLTRDQVRAQIEEHIAVEVYPLIRYVGVIPFITEITPGTNSILFKWLQESEDYKYNVYISIDKDGPFGNAINLTPLDDVLLATPTSLDDNQYEITQIRSTDGSLNPLASDTEYSFYVTAFKTGDIREGFPSRKITIKTLES